MIIDSRLPRPMKKGFILELIPVRKAAEELAVHENTIRRWNARGILKAYRIGARGDRRFLLSDIKKLRIKMKSNSGNNRVRYRSE